MTSAKLRLPHGREHLESMTWEDWLQAHELSPQCYEFMRAFFGMSQLYAEPRDISALEAVEIVGGLEVFEDGGAETWMIKGGIQGPAKAMAKALSNHLLLDAPVSSISQDDTGAVVTAQPRSGSAVRVRAKRVLFSGAPHTSLKVDFVP